MHSAVGNEQGFFDYLLTLQKAVQIGLAQKWVPAQDTPEGGFGAQKVREVVTMAVDWLKIKNDYINGGGSYRELAERHGVSIDTIKKRAAVEKWKDARTEYAQNVHQKVQEETASILVSQEVKRVERLLTITNQFVDRIEQAVRELNRTQVTNKKKTKVIEYKNSKRPDKPTKEIIDEQEEILAVASIVDRKGLQQIATALKAVWDITGENEANNGEGIEDDGLLAALGSNAKAVFDDGDDSNMLPKEKES